jgi:hypothetical protein
MKFQEQPAAYELGAVNSPLQKCRALGLVLPRDLETLAMQRGCGYYGSGEFQRAVHSAGDALSNAELAIALLSPLLPTTHRLVRIGSMILSAADVNPAELVALARVEGCAGVLRHIAEAGSRYEPENDFWRVTLGMLHDVAPEGPHLPHPTRFVEMTAVTRGRVGLFTHWLRARPLASLRGA